MVEILKIIEDKYIEIRYNNKITRLNEKDWLHFIKTLDNLRVTISQPIYIEHFQLSRKVIEYLFYNEKVEDLINIPERKPCSSTIYDWVSNYLENSKEVGYTEDILQEVKKTLVAPRQCHLFRGGYTCKPLPQVGDVVNFELVKSWSSKKEIAYGFAQDEQRAIEDFKVGDEIPVLYELEGIVDVYVPTEYCDKISYLLFANEFEVNTVEIQAEVTGIFIPEDEKGRKSPIHHVMLKPLTVSSF